jgi:hypothetical protein
VSDTTVPLLDYTWEWRNGYDLAESGPFRYVFPHYRLNANVNEHPRAALLAFVEGALLNVMPGAMERRLSDCPALVATLRRLAWLRRRFLVYFTEGQYHYQEGLAASGCVARLYSHAGRTLVLAVNPGDQPAEVLLLIDPPAPGVSSRPVMLHVYDLDGDELDSAAYESDQIRYSTILGADDLRVIELVPVEEKPSGGAFSADDN